MTDNQIKKMKEQKYKPISCDYYDELEIVAMHQTVAEIIFRNEKGEETTISTKVKTLQTRDSEEFLILDNGDEIRLDKLVSMNGKVLKNYC